ncbi:MAG: ABC transporter permease [Thermoplasmata archaeon]
MRTTTEGTALGGPFRGTSAFFWTEVLVQAHELTAMATSMVVQGVVLAFVWILDPSLLGVAFCGAIIFSMFTMGQRLLNEAAYIRIDHKANDLYLASPLTPEGYFFGMASGILFVYITPVLVIGVLAELVVHFTIPEALLLIGLCASVWIFSASIGYVFSTFFRDNRAIWAYATLFFTTFGVVFPVFYPFTLFPASIQPIALLLPPSAAATVMQAAIGAIPVVTNQLILASVALVGETLALFAFAVYWVRRTVREG